MKFQHFLCIIPKKYEIAVKVYNIPLRNTTERYFFPKKLLLDFNSNFYFVLFWCREKIN
jgi:hypothetical protein